MHSRAAIDRYLQDVLPPAEEVRMRAHLAGCQPCRRYLDDQAVLFRALAGDPAQPTRREEQRLQDQVFATLNLAPPVPVSVPPATPWLEAVLWHPLRTLVLSGGALTVAVLLLLWPRPAPEVPRQPDIARAVVARGILVNGGSGERNAQVDDGALVEVARNGLAELKLSRGGRLRLFPDTRIQLHDGGNDVELLRGRLWCTVDRGQGAFTVHSDQAVVRVTGTSFVVDATAEDATEVRVLEGSVTVEDHRGTGTVEVRGGQQTRVQSGSAPRPVNTYNPRSDSADWESFLRRLAEELERGLQQIKDALTP